MNTRWNLWSWSFLWSLLFLILFGWWHGGFADGFIINRTFADAGFVLIALSFALSGVAHFCKAGWLLVHRKYLGLLGFYLILVHAALSLFLFRLPHFFQPMRLVPFLFAVTSTLFFTWLAVISTDYWMRRLKQDWRRWLRAGYIALALGMAHFFLLYWRSWSAWFSSPKDFPEPSLLLAFFGILVFLLRGALWLKLKK